MIIFIEAMTYALYIIVQPTYPYMRAVIMRHDFKISAKAQALIPQFLTPCHGMPTDGLFDKIHIGY